MIKGRKELYDIKCNDTGMTLFEPFCLNEMSEIDASISCGPLFDAFKLIRVQEAIGYYMKLKSIANDFLNEFTGSV